MSISKQLIVYGRYLVQGDDETTMCLSASNWLSMVDTLSREVKNSSLQICELIDGKGETIESKICQVCDELQLDLQKLCGLGSDGASVMLGVRGDISTLLKEQTSFLVANHCIAHHLAVACGQAANEIPHLKRFKDILDQLYRYYENSVVHTAGLRAIQEVLNDPHLKFTQAKDVRWLSH